MTGAPQRPTIRLASPAGEGGAGEDQVRGEVMTYLKINNWIVARIEQRMGMTKGTPDLIAGKNGRAIWIELKSRPGYTMTKTGHQRKIKEGVLSDDQRGFALRWSITGIPVILARSWRDVHRILVDLGIENND